MLFTGSFNFLKISLSPGAVKISLSQDERLKTDVFCNLCYFQQTYWTWSFRSPSMHFQLKFLKSSNCIIFLCLALIWQQTIKWCKEIMKEIFLFPIWISPAQKFHMTVQVICEVAPDQTHLVYLCIKELNYQDQLNAM